MAETDPDDIETVRAVMRALNDAEYGDLTLGARAVVASLDSQGYKITRKKQADKPDVTEMDVTKMEEAVDAAVQALRTNEAHEDD